MPTLADAHVHDLASARIGRMLIRYRFFIHAIVLMLAVLLALADRRHTPGIGAATQASRAPAPAAAPADADDKPLVLPDR